MVRLPPDPRAAQGLNKTGCQGRLVESIAGRYSAFRAAAACIRPCGTSRSCSAAVSVAMRGTLPFSCREKARRHGTGTQPQALKRSEEHTSEHQSLMRISYAVFCLKKKITNKHIK